MVPLVFGRPELDLVKAIIVAMAEAVAKETGVKTPYQVGTMIELPRAALRAGEIAESAEFFSFGTNDLTQTTLGVSRDDAASFLGIYTVKGLLKADPFVTLDTEGVGELVTIAAERGRETRPDIKLGVCGEHGGDPASIAFCEQAGLDYVSCSPFRIPIARLAAAQAALGRKAAKHGVRGAGHCSGTPALRRPSRTGSSWARNVGSSLTAVQTARAREMVKRRVERETGLDRGTRLVQPTKLRERGGQVKMRVRKISVGLDRPPTPGDRLLVARRGGTCAMPA